MKTSKKRSSTEFIRGLARGGLYALVRGIIRTDSWRRRREKERVDSLMRQKLIDMMKHYGDVRFVGSCEINPAATSVNKNSCFVRSQIPPHSAPRAYWVTDWLSDCRELRATSHPAWVHTRSHCVERQRARSLVCFRGWSSWGTSVDQSSFLSHHRTTEQTLLEDFPAFYREPFRGAFCLGSLVAVVSFDFLVVCIDAQCSFFLIYVNSFTGIESSLWKFCEFFECISVKSFNGIVNRVIRNKSSVIVL